MFFGHVFPLLWSAGNLLFIHFTWCYMIFFFKQNFGRSLYILNPNFFGIFVANIFSWVIIWFFNIICNIFVYFFHQKFQILMWSYLSILSFKNFSFLCPVYEFLLQVIIYFCVFSPIMKPIYFSGSEYSLNLCAFHQV